MQGDSEDAVGVVEGELDAVAMMAVDVDVRDAKAATEHFLDRQHRVVEDAEAIGVSRHGMMEPAGDVEGGIVTLVQE